MTGFRSERLRFGHKDIVSVPYIHVPDEYHPDDEPSVIMLQMTQMEAGLLAKDIEEMLFGGPELTSKLHVKQFY